VLKIDPASITPQREAGTALKSADFFDVQRCPEMTYKSTRSTSGRQVQGDGRILTCTA